MAALFYFTFLPEKKVKVQRVNFGPGLFKAIKNV
jgi:hypothetical protein